MSQRTEQPSGTAKRVSLSDELRAFYDLSELPAYRSHTLSAQVSSYDTTGGNNDGFDGNYSFVRRNPDSSLVILDLKGSGVINRFWTPTPTEDTLDFYIDDTTRPVLSIKYKDLFSGKVYPFVSPLCGSALGGDYCYFPILFQRRCMIIARAKKMQFHQIQYRLFEKGSGGGSMANRGMGTDERIVVQPFTGRLTDEEKGALAAIGSLWRKKDRTTGGNAIKTVSAVVELAPGETRSIFNLSRGGRITGVELSPSAAFEGPVKDIDLRIYWDDEALPAVYCPVSDFFGYAFGRHSMQSLLIGSEAGRNYCYIPMPFDKKARIELVYRKSGNGQGVKGRGRGQAVRKDGLGQAVKLNARIFYTLQKRDADREGKLYTCWKKERPAAGKPHVFLQASGKGHYIGTILQAQGLEAGMTYFFEGDDSTVIDGQQRLHGTGSEDYFNGGWYALLDCWDSKMSLPLHGCLDYSLPYCRTGGYRFYLSDKLSFEKNIYHSIEHGPVNNRIPVEYTSLAFYYSSAAVTELTDPASTPRQTYIPDTLVLYPQLLEYSIEGAIGTKTEWAYPTGGESFIFTVGDGSMLRISLKDILPGTYKAFADFEASPEGCDFSLWQRQAQSSGWISSYAAGKKRIEQEYLGEIRVDDLANTITLRFRASARKTIFFLNRIILIRQGQGGK